MSAGTMTAPSFASPVGTMRWRRLIPAAMIVYIISFMDRTNIGYAFAGIGRDFHVGKAEQGLAGGIFFIGYVLLQIPGGWLAEHWSAKKFVGIMILLWGAAALWCSQVSSFNELLIARFILGVAEGGIWPAILVLITHWFPMGERARAYSLWMANLAIASIITQPLSGWIVQETSWRTMILIEGILPFVIATPVWWLLVADRPEEAPWVSEAERAHIARSIAADRAGEAPHGSFASIFAEPTVWRLVIVYFLIQVGFYGLNLWLPTLLKTLTAAGFGLVGLVATLPYLTAIVGMWLNGSAADRNRRYQRHVLLPLAVAAVCLMASVLVGHAQMVLAIIFICLAMGGALSYDGPFWAAASRAMPVVVAGGAMGLINALGNLGGFLGPLLAGRLQDATGSFLATAALLAASLLAAGLFMTTLRLRPAPTAP